MDFLIVTGLSGAGKSRAVDALEDIGFYCVDNMPPQLISKVAEICLAGNSKISRVAVVTGRGRLHGASVKSTDLRGGAALAVAALGAEGESVISNLAHIDRGYASLEKDLEALGGHVIRQEIIE